MDFGDRNSRLPVDVVIPVYGERLDGLVATLSGCLNQTYPVSKIYVVDDGSPQPVTLPQSIDVAGKVHILRLAKNQGPAIARNTAVARCSAPLLGLIDCEVVPAPDWIETCVHYLSVHPEVGACSTPFIPQHPRRILTRWRMRCAECWIGGPTRKVDWAPGHSTLMRREALEKVGGYDPRYGYKVGEESDLGIRMGKAGWETHHINESYCLSVQQDTLASLSAKLLHNSNWRSVKDYSLAGVFADQTKWFLVRMARNVIKGRLLFVPIDVALWIGALKIATERTLAGHNQRGQTEKRHVSVE